MLGGVMSERLKKNLSFTAIGVAYIWAGVAVANVSRFMSPALIIIGICLLGAVVVDLVRPSNAGDLHIKP